MARGYSELGEVYQTLGKAAGRADVVAAGAAMLGEAKALKADFLSAIERSALPSPPSLDPRANGARGIPHIFGWQMLNGGPRNDTEMAHSRDGHSTYTHPTLDVFTQARLCECSSPLPAFSVSHQEAAACRSGGLLQRVPSGPRDGRDLALESL